MTDTRTSITPTRTWIHTHGATYHDKFIIPKIMYVLYTIHDVIVQRTVYDLRESLKHGMQQLDAKSDMENHLVQVTEKYRKCHRIMLNVQKERDDLQREVLLIDEERKHLNQLYKGECVQCIVVSLWMVAWVGGWMKG